MTFTILNPTRTRASRSASSLETPSLPPYSEFPPEDLAGAAADVPRPGSLASSLAASDDAEPPGAAARAPFAPTTQLQIETPGKSWFSHPGPPRPDPVAVFVLGPDGRPLPRPVYLSLRPARWSGSCALVCADDTDAKTPLTTTTYRFGVGRRPQIRLLVGPAGDQGDGGEGEACEMVAPRLLSRAQRVEVPSLGTFEWRYARRWERWAEAADNLLVLEWVAPPLPPTTTGQQPPLRTRIAQLVRAEGLRTPGTSRSAAGNGGRLMLDLRVVDEKARERVELLAVTTALAMLKKEVDRRRMQQVAIISGGGGC